MAHTLRGVYERFYEIIIYIFDKKDIFFKSDFDGGEARKMKIKIIFTVFAFIELGVLDEEFHTADAKKFFMRGVRKIVAGSKMRHANA